MIPAEAVEAAAIAMLQSQTGIDWESRSDVQQDVYRMHARTALEAAAPHMLADILEDAANTAETDELTTAAEVIYDLRRHAKDLRPTNAD